ncbi:MAG TPA: septal ring lytic transglycosylase RlpA family protein [Burkholderiaceae bacterium]|nr:septal ring lytic transglycosylase RlpA family protein [Burkholderiaceae bacterium]
MPYRLPTRWLAPGIALALAGCATRAPAPLPGADGPQANPPPAAQLLQVPDALPQLEPIRSGGPNKPYVALGEAYVPLAPEARYREEGLASWYGRKFHGRPTASGEPYDMYAMTAAHPTLPLPSYARVTNPANGRSVIVRVNDRGPFAKGRIIDLSYTAALKLDLLRGVAPVRVERITPAQIRSGAWRGAPAPPIEGDDGPPEAVASSAPPWEATPSAARPPDAGVRAARGFWVQLGAFREREGAAALQQQAAARVDGLGGALDVVSEQALHRVQAGPYATREDALRVAERIRQALALVPVVLDKR